MIDMGQSIPRVVTPAWKYEWKDVHVYNHQRGTICVIRQSNGRPEALAVSMQNQWQEWSGAFCVL